MEEAILNISEKVRKYLQSRKGVEVRIDITEGI
jgi:hypothetical protein